MKPLPLNEQELSFIKRHSKIPRRELHEKFSKEFGRADISIEQLKHLCKSRGWHNGRSCLQKCAIGRERVTAGFIEVCVKNEKPGKLSRIFVLKHRLLWEQTHGPIPDGMYLKCKGDQLNTDPSNWDLVTAAMLPRLQIHGVKYAAAPSELKPTIMALARLEQQVRETRKAHQQREK